MNEQRRLHEGRRERRCAFRPHLRAGGAPELGTQNVPQYGRGGGGAEDMARDAGQMLGHLVSV